MNGATRLTLATLALLWAFPADLAAQPPRTDAHGDPLPDGALYRFGTTRWRHGAGIDASALSPDGQSLATASARSVIVWDTATGRRVRYFPCRASFAYFPPGIAFSPDGRHLGYVRNGEFAYVWDLRSGREVLHFEGDRGPDSELCQFTSDGKEFALMRRGAVRFWDLRSAKETRSAPSERVSLLSPDAATSVRTEDDKALIFIDVKTGKEKYRWDVAAARNGIRHGIAFAPDGRTVAAVHQDKEIQIRTAATGAPARPAIPLPDSAKVPWRGRGCRLSFSRDGKALDLATPIGEIRRWDLATGKELPKLVGPPAATGCHLLADGKTVLSTGDAGFGEHADRRVLLGNGDGLIRRWDAATGRELGVEEGYTGWTCTAISPDGQYAAAGDVRGRIDLWDTAVGKRLHDLRTAGPAVMSLAFAPDGRSLAVGLASGEVRFWEVSSGRQKKALRWPEERNLAFADALLFTPGGRNLYVSHYHDKPLLWEVATGKVLWRGVGDRAAALSPDGGTLVTALSGPFLHVRDTATGKERPHLLLNTALRKDDIVVNALAFSPDGRRLAVALRDGNISLCEAATGVEERQFLGSVLALAFSPDSKWLLTGGSDDTVRVWEAATGVEVLRRNGHEGGVLYVAFGGGGRTALSSGRDGQAYLWDLRPAPGPNVPLAELWANLAGDAPKAYRAVWALSERDGAASLFREKIAPVPPVEPARVKKWIADLNSAQFKVRAEAARALAGLDELAAPAMEAALKKKPALEVEQRLRKLLAALKRVPTPEELRRRRAVQALELAGTPEARSVLREWAGGAPGARLTEDARSALARLVEQGAARR